MSGGGSGGSGTQQYNWNDTMKPYWEGALSQGQGLSQTPYQQYQGQRIAGLNSDQTNALGIGEHMIYNGGLPVTQAANNQGTDTLNDTYLTGNMANPYASQANPYSGMDSPYFNQTMQQGATDLARAYQQGTAADTTKMFNLAGALGGSANQTAVANNQMAFGHTLDNYLAGMQNDQYNRSAQLTDSQLGRGSAAYEGERNREMQAMGQGTAGQQNFFQGLQQLMGLGDVQRGYTQDVLNQGYNDFQAQKQYPYSQLDYLTGLLGRAQGGIAPNSTTTTSGYAASPYSQILGAGLLGYGALH